MAENDNQQPDAATENACPNTTTGQLGLTVLGVVFVSMGIIPGLGTFLYDLIRALSRPFSRLGIIELLIGLVLFCGVPAKFIRAIPKAVLGTVLGIWLLWGLCQILPWTLLYLDCEQDDRIMLRLLIAVFGLILICSNGWLQWLLQRMRAVTTRTVLWGRVHAKMTLITLLAGLWLLNPYHSHKTCLQASRVAENFGYYHTAAIFTKLARDTFPSDTWCATCFGQIQEGLTIRIDYLERKSTGQETDVKLPPKSDRRTDETPQVPSWNAINATAR
jgi:hypothetical protein